MACADCGKALSRDGGRPPAICGGCYSPKATYCGEARLLLFACHKVPAPMISVLRVY
jgi:hypothetical protein